MRVSNTGTVPELFLQQAATTPDSIAVVFEGASYTYRELDEYSNQIARYLRRYNAGPELPVGVCLERSHETIAIILGIFKAGCALVPIDRMLPPERIRQMISLANARIVITQASPVWNTGEDGYVCLDIAQERDTISREDTTPVMSGVGPDNLAYFIFTSGSTGEPKGVMMPHEGIVHRVARTQRLHGIDVDDRVLQIGSLSFDISVWEIFVPLLTGGRVVVADERRISDFKYLVGLIQRERVTIARFVPSILQMFIEEQEISACDSLRRIITGGDTMTLRLMNSFLSQSDIRLFNQYGPSERPSSISWECERQERLTSVSIGRPHAGTDVYILDRGGNLVPRGTPGELYIGGLGLARGYAHRPDLTAEKFLPHPFSRQPGARLYRTGDLVRFLPDGNLEFIGRVDFQVKIGGIRVELKEVEYHLAKHPSVREAVVVAHETGKGKQLVAYVLSAGPVDPADIKSYLARWLPAPMIPSHIVHLESFPLNRNGKIDKRALPAPPGNQLDDARMFVGPRDEIEERLVVVWKEILARQDIGVFDNFFDLGGHSLKAIRIIWRLQELLDVDVRLADIFVAPTVAALSARVRELMSLRDNSVAPRQTAGDCPVSPAQHRLWVIHKMAPESPAYNMGRVFLLAGQLNVAALRAALNIIVERHQSLRTTFVEDEGRPKQRISSELEDYFEEVDLSAGGLDEDEAQRLARQEFSRPFDLQSGPLLRAKVFRLQSDKHILTIVTHHIIADGWSLGIFLRELSAAYSSVLQGKDLNLEPVLSQYRDYAESQQRLLSGPSAEQHRQYWASKLGGDPTTLDLPTDGPRQLKALRQGERLVRYLSPDLTTALRNLSGTQNASVFTCLLSAVKILLYRYTGQEEIITGTVANGRTQAAWRHQIGFFVNTLALRDTVRHEDTFMELLAKVKTTLTEALEFEAYPFDMVVADLGIQWDRRRSPLFDVMVVFDDSERSHLGLEDVEAVRIMDIPAVSLFDLTFEFREVERQVQVEITFDSDLFSRLRIEMLWESLARIMRAMVEHPSARIGEIDITPDEEKRIILEDFNDTRVLREISRGIGELFDEQARRTPEAGAIVMEGRVVNYEQLSRDSSLLAEYLVENCGTRREDRVAVIFDRSELLITSLLGIIKACAAYVPIDPDLPESLISYMIEDSDCAAIICDAKYAGRLQQTRRRLLIVQDVLAEMKDKGASGRCLRAEQNNLAYVIYTSGSTGKPKGVAIQHGALVNLCDWHREAFGVDENSRAMMYAGIGFDASTWEVWPYLLSGGSLYPVNGETRLDLKRLSEFITRSRLTHLFLPTPVCQQLVNARAPLPENLLVLTGGEALGALGQRSFRVVNNYGPTENTVVATSIDLERKSYAERPPIGRPIANVETLVLDRELRLCPIGAIGEICISGVGLARGYLNQAGLTSAVFIPHPYKVGERLYKTGDMGRWSLNGNMEYFSRRDDQLKLRGYRVEPGEIEHALRQHAAVKDSRVLPYEAVDGEKRLVAFLIMVVPIEAQALRDHLLKRVPAYMIPSAFLFLEQFPLTVNGKVDKPALLKFVPQTLRQEAGYVAPETDVEQALARIWADVFGVKRVGARDNFLDMGGNSLTAIKIVAAIESKLDVRLAASELFRASELKDLAELIETATQAGLQRRSRMSLVLLNEARAPRAFFMPSVFGYAVAFNRLASHVESCAIFGFDVPPQGWAIDEYAEALIEAEPQDAFILLGYSIGGNLAFEVAKELEGRGRTVSDIILMDSSWRQTARSVTEQELEAEISMLLSQNSFADDGRMTAATENERETPESALRARVKKLLSGWYAGTDSGRVRANIHFLTSRDTSPAKLRNWGAATDGSFAYYEGYGEHLAMLDGENVVRNGTLLASVLDQILCPVAALEFNES
ncbi:MAG: amino acid adenylation domain-containing protein [Pyrinomonadaceae bacterium]